MFGSGESKKKVKDGLLLFLGCSLTGQRDTLSLENIGKVNIAIYMGSLGNCEIYF